MGGLTREQASKVKVGDELIPDPLWNRTERTRKLNTPTIVQSIAAGVSQTGVLFEVAFMTGERSWLDAGWFHEGQRKVK